MRNMIDVSFSISSRFAMVTYATDAGQLTVAVYSLKLCTKIAVFPVPETHGFSKDFISVSMSPDDRFMMLQLGSPDWALLVWVIPSHIGDACRFFSSSTATLKNVYVSLKVTMFHRLQKEVLSAMFHPYKPDYLLVNCPQASYFYRIFEGALALGVQIRIKRILGRFTSVFFIDDQITLLVSVNTGEILILRNEHLLSFIPSEHLFGARVMIATGISTNFNRYIRQFVISNHAEEIPLKPSDPEEITCITVVDKSILIVGSSHGRVLVYLLQNIAPAPPQQTGHELTPLQGSADNAFDRAKPSNSLLSTALHTDMYSIPSTIEKDGIPLPDFPAQMLPCRAAGGVAIRVPTILLLRSILLPCKFNAVRGISVQQTTSVVLLTMKNGQTFVSTTLTKAKLDIVISAQKSLQQDNESKGMCSTLLSRMTGIPVDELEPLSSSTTRDPALRDTLPASEDQNNEMPFKPTECTSQTNTQNQLALSTEDKGLSQITKQNSLLTTSYMDIYKTSSSANGAALLSAFETILKLRQMLRRTRKLKVNDSFELSVYSPVKALTGSILDIPIKNENVSEMQLDIRIYSDPKRWPLCLVEASVYEPFVPFYQVASPILNSLTKGVYVSGELVTPSRHGQGYHTGTPFPTKNSPITCMDHSDETGYVAIGDDSGTIRVLDVVNFLPVASWTWSRAEIGRLIGQAPNKAPQQKASRASKMNALYANATLAKAGMDTDTLPFGGDDIDTAMADRPPSRSLTAGAMADAPAADTLANEPVDSDIMQLDHAPYPVSSKYSIQCLAYHTSGRHLVAASKSTIRRSDDEANVFSVVVLHVVDGELSPVLVVDIENAIVQMTFDSTGNFLYVLSERHLYVFGYFEMRLIKRVELTKRIFFIPSSGMGFSRVAMLKYKSILAALRPEARPKYLSVHENSCYTCVSFEDGDVILVNAFNGRIIGRYLTGGIIFGITTHEDAQPSRYARSVAYDQHYDNAPLPVLPQSREAEEEPSSMTTAAAAAASVPHADHKSTAQPSIKAGFYLIQHFFIPQKDFDDRNAECQKRYSLLDVPHMPIVGVCSDGSMQEFHFEESVSVVGRLGIQTAPPDAGRTSLAAKAALSQRVPSQLSQLRPSSQSSGDSLCNNADPNTESPHAAPTDTPLNTALQHDAASPAATMTVPVPVAEAPSIPFAASADMPPPSPCLGLYSGTYLTNVILGHGVDAYRSWQRLAPSSAVVAMNDKSSEVGKFLAEEGIFSSMLLNSSILATQCQLLFATTAGGATMVHPFPFVSPAGALLATASSAQHHSRPIAHACVVRGSYVVTASTDGMVLVSRLRYPGMPFAARPSVRSALGRNHVVRTRPLQTALDVLLFELLTRLLLLRTASAALVRDVGRASGDALQGLLRRFFDAKRDALCGLSAATAGHEAALARRGALQQRRDHKQRVLLEEVTGSYREQEQRLAAERGGLYDALLADQRAGDAALAAFEDETQARVARERQRTEAHAARMAAELERLSQDEQMLREVRDRAAAQAAEALETQLAGLRAGVEAVLQSEVDNVGELRRTHRALEHDFVAQNRQATAKKAQLVTLRSEVSQALRDLSLAHDQLGQTRADIVERECIAAEKARAIEQLGVEISTLERQVALQQGKCAELRACVAPRDDLLTALTTQVGEMDRELLQDAARQQAKELETRDLRLRRQGLRREIAARRAEARDYAFRLKAFLEDVLAIVARIPRAGLASARVGTGTGSRAGSPAPAAQARRQSPQSSQSPQRPPRRGAEDRERFRSAKECVACIRTLYLKHCSGRGLSTGEASRGFAASLGAAGPGRPGASVAPAGPARLADDINERQKQYLEKSITTLEKSLERRRMQLTHAIEKSRTHSSDLLGLSNMMRRENKLLQQQLRASKLEFIKKRQAAGRLRNLTFDKNVSRVLMQINDEIAHHEAASGVGAGVGAGAGASASADTGEGGGDRSLISEAANRFDERLQQLASGQGELDEYLSKNFPTANMSPLRATDRADESVLEDSLDAGAFGPPSDHSGGTAALLDNFSEDDGDDIEALRRAAEQSLQANNLLRSDTPPLEAGDRAVDRYGIVRPGSRSNNGRQGTAIGGASGRTSALQMKSASVGRPGVVPPLTSGRSNQSGKQSIQVGMPKDTQLHDLDALAQKLPPLSQRKHK